MNEKLRFLGLDVHAETIAVAVAEPNGEVRSLGMIANREDSIRKFIRKLGSPEHLRAYAIMSVCQRNEQKPIKHSEKLIYSTRSRPTVHHRIRGKNHARTSTKPLCGSSKRLLRSIKP